MHLFLGATLDSCGPDDYLCGIIHPGFGLKLKLMWVIKTKDIDTYLESMYKSSNGNIHLSFMRKPNAFRFPDEQTAQAVLKFLNRDNLEVACISGSN